MNGDIYSIARELIRVLSNIPQRYLPDRIRDDMHSLQYALRAQNGTEDFAKTLLIDLDSNVQLIPHQIVYYRNQLAAAIDYGVA